MTLISDAGTPILSDPGRILINECINNKIKIIPIPGVSSITSAMSVSGFDDKFLFFGFLPKKRKRIRKNTNTALKNSLFNHSFCPCSKNKLLLKKA